MSTQPRHPGLFDAKGRELPHRVIEVCGVKTYVVEAGEGPPVLLIHGYGDTADGWRKVVPRLLESHRVIAIDVPPFGRSGTPDAGDLIDFHAGFMPSLIEHLGIGPAIVVGHSLGGALALDLALERPDLVSGLGLIAPAGVGEGPPWFWHLLRAGGLLSPAVSMIPGPLVPAAL